jgi:hypothetical protein
MKKRSKIAYCGAFLSLFVIAAIVILFRSSQREDPVEIIFKQLRASVPRSKIVYAKQTQFGREPTFVGIILIDDETRQTLSWDALGCVRVDYEPQREQVRRAVIYNFKSYTGFPGSNQIQGGEICVGVIRNGSYYLSAFVAKTNAYLIFQRY